MNMRYLCQPCPSDDTLLAAMIFIAVGFTMVLIIIAWLSNRLGQNFAEQSVAERERKMIALKKRQALMQSVAAPKLLQVLQEKVECRVRDAVIVTSADVQVDLASSTTEACKVLASIRAWSADASRHQALGNISDALEAQAQVDDLQETARKMVMFAPGDIRQCAMEQVYSESLESRNVTCLETKADLDVGPTTSLSLDDMGEVLNHQTKRTREREFWQQLSWGEKLQAILEEDGAEEAIEAAFQYQLKLETTAAENSGAHVLSHMQQEDKIQNRLKSVGHKRTRWSSMLQDRIGTEGGYGSCSPVLLFKVFFSALQVLALARRYDFEWPGYLQEVFEAQATASGGNTFTVDCFFPGTIGKVYERAALMVITPPILGMIAFSYFMLRYLFGLKGIPSLITGPLFGTNEDLEGTGFVVMTRAQKEFLRSIMLPETDDIFLCILNKWPTRLELWRPVKDLVTGEFLRFQHKYNHNTAPWKSQEELISAVQQQESSGEREVIPGWALKDFLCKIVPHTDRFGITRKMWTLDFTQGRRKEEDLYNLDDNSADDTARLRLAQIAIADGFAQHAKLRLKDQAADKFKQTCHVWGFLLWPVLTQEVLSLFSCYSIGDTYYIFGETEIECYTGDYWLYAVVIGLPGLCMSFGLLFATYSVVKTNASKIRNCDFRTTRKYAFLFADYSTEHHYWEVCIMLRKLGAVISAVCLVSAGVVAQALACLFVITAAAVAHIRARPYDHWLPDALESASLFTCFVTLYFGVYLHTVSESSFAEACSVIILMVQMLFVSFFIFALIRSLQAFAEQAQITAFISESARLSTCQFGWLYFKTRATCKNLDDQLFSLALPADKLVQNLTKHLYGWPIEKRWDMYNLIRDKYSPRWKAFVSNRRSEKYGLVLCQLFSSLENVRSHHSLKSTFASLMFNWEQYREWLKKGKLERRVTRMARLYEDPDHTHQVTAPRIAPARGANGDDSGEPM